MYLVKKDIKSEEIKVNVTFEKVVDDLLMISVMPQLQNNNVPSYWRLTKVKGIPPLEIGVNCRNGELISITFYVDLSYIKKQKEFDVNVNRGNVLVETNIFKQTNDYVDIDKGYEIYMEENRLVCIFEDIEKVEQSYKNDRIEVYLNKNNEVIGFSICD